jgi:hypothetical protein
MAWEILYIYGTFKTAMSVTRKLRSEGKKVRAREQGNGNCVVEIWKNDDTRSRTPSDK